MPPASLTDQLCTRCGLCCDGSLFADVELSGPAEADAMESLALPIDEDSDAELMLLPCRALKGTRCGIYAHRPKCCRTFECGLLQNARRGLVSVDQALAHIGDARTRIAGVKALVAKLTPRAERLPLEELCAEALTADPGAPAGASRTRAELVSAMAAVRALIRRAFLTSGSGRPR